MEKKIFKRSMALGALIAFVITGNAMAEDLITNTVDTDVDDQNIYAKIVVFDSSSSESTESNNTLTIKDGVNITHTTNQNNYISAVRFNFKRKDFELKNNVLSIEGGNISSKGINAVRVLPGENYTYSGINVLNNQINITGGNITACSNNGEKISVVLLKYVEKSKIEGNSLYVDGNANISEDMSIVSMFGYNESLDIKNNTMTLAGNAKINNAGIYAYTIVSQNENWGATREEVITSATNNTLKIDSTWSGSQLNTVSAFDNIEIDWEQTANLNIATLNSNHENGESGQNEPLDFKLNDIGTKVEIGDFCTKAADGSTIVEEKVNVIGTDRVRNEFGDDIKDVKNISDTDIARLNTFAQAVTAEKINGVDTTADNKYLSSMLTLEETDFYGMWEAPVTNGEVDITNAKSYENVANLGAVEMANLSLISLKQQTNDMNKRMGELRNANGEHGVWVRMVRGEQEYKSIDSQYNQYQLGYDEKLSVDKRWTVGAAVSYTEAENSFTRGSGETDNTAFAIYGSKLNNDGSFVDLIAKYARIENDFKLTGASIGDSDYGVNSYSISAEVGKRIEQDKGFWIEPQAELSYGKVASVNYKTARGIEVHQDSSDILIGRLGFSLGKDIKQGNVYVRASYLYDFAGETGVSISDKAAGISKDFTDDLGGGWWEVGVGANINLSKSTYIYADVEKTFGGEVDTNWQWNLGVRYSF